MLLDHLVFDEPQNEYPICILTTSLFKQEIQKEYLDSVGLPGVDVIAIKVHQKPYSKKTPMAEIKDYISTVLVPCLDTIKAKYLVVTDADYLKALTKVTNVAANLGYVLDSHLGPWKVVYVPNYRSIFYDPVNTRTKIKQGLDALLNHVSSSYIAPGSSIIKFQAYPRTPEEIQSWLDRILEMGCPVSVDVETFDLKHYKSGIGTITLCWNQHEGIAFPVDYMPIPGATEAPYGEYVPNHLVRGMLKDFFKKCSQKTIYHHISFDVTILIYNLFMDHLTDQESLLEGLDVMLSNWDDTKLITYLATNSCAGNDLSLKEQAQEFAGNYAESDIKDITKIPLDRLLTYNLVDGLSTWFTYYKHWDTLVHDEQEEIYNDLFKPAIVDIVQMQLTGMPLDMQRVHEVHQELLLEEADALQRINSSRTITAYNHHIRNQWVVNKNSTLKKKRVTIADVPSDVVFNPNSPVQLQELLYDILNLPVLSRTKTKQPSADGETIKSLVNHTSDPDVIQFLNAMNDYATVKVILSNFLPAMLAAPQGIDGWHYLFGSFNLGGTVSGRLSSSDPNIQNIPAGNGDPNDKKTIYGKMIKSCFVAPPGWIFCGLDFSSLEDMISALTTRDPNKLKVYIEKYDGHSLRAFAYFKDEMPDIVDTVDSINSIGKMYKHLRTDSKAPTFALTYQGTHHTLMKNLGWPKEKALQVENNYKELYKVSIDWVQDKLTEASQKGYVTAAFGLRVRTPLLAQVVRGTSRTPYEAEAEGRTAGNALGQSWCLLNTRASVEFMQGVRKSNHRLDIRPCAHIHDAQYMMVRDELQPLMYVNKHLVNAVKWQDHPEIFHDTVKIGGELSVFYPNWCTEHVIPNDATEADIVQIASSGSM